MGEITSCSGKIRKRKIEDSSPAETSFTRPIMNTATSDMTYSRPVRSGSTRAVQVRQRDRPPHRTLHRADHIGHPAENPGELTQCDTGTRISARKRKKEFLTTASTAGAAGLLRLSGGSRLGGRVNAVVALVHQVVEVVLLHLLVLQTKNEKLGSDSARKRTARRRSVGSPFRSTRGGRPPAGRPCQRCRRRR